ncbi:MAG: hypothetical protein L0Y54_12230 [Sporichthyaceae bacterium]|nr:hypothetical protein [Sporichthyaceae bacterium]
MTGSKKTRWAARAVLLAVPAALLIGAVVAPALADDAADDASRDGIAGAKARVTHRIDMRLNTLGRLDGLLARAERLSDEHRDTLSALIDDDTAGLTELRAQVASETTREALRADAQSMVEDYRIYILVRPKVRLSVVADRELAAIDRLTDIHARLTDAVADAEEAGQDTGNADELLDAMQAQLDAATAAVQGQTDQLLAIEPGPDGPGIRSAVDEIRESLRDARQDLRDAIRTARHIRALLRGALD